MSGLSWFHVERMRPDGSWEMILANGEPAFVCEWPNRDFQRWVFDGRRRDEFGPPPPATVSYPADASPETGRIELLHPGHPEGERIGWMRVAPLLAHDNPIVREWVNESLLAGLRDLGVDPAAELRLIIVSH